jgi:hypothetical protein
MPAKQKQAVIAQMEPMFKEAEEKGLWFYTDYQGLWFSPSQLRNSMDKESFCWPPANWRLRNPLEFIQEKLSLIEKAKQSIEHVITEIQNSKK